MSVLFQSFGALFSGVNFHFASNCRPLEDIDSSPPCMADVFQCMGRAARAALCAVARHLRLRSE